MTSLSVGYLDSTHTYTHSEVSKHVGESTIISNGLLFSTEVEEAVGLWSGKLNIGWKK